MVFTLLQDAVTDFSGQAQRGKRDAKYLEQILWLLQSIVEYLAPLINRAWQTKALHAVICNLLYRENKLELRLKGLDIYLAFMTALRPPEEGKIIRRCVCERACVFSCSLRAVRQQNGHKTRIPCHCWASVSTSSPTSSRRLVR